MCYNPEVSLITFIFGCISAFIIYKLNIVNKEIIIILLSFTAIQFIEFLVWINYNNEKINKLLGKIAFIIIIIQILLLQIFLLKKSFRIYSLILFFILFIIFIIIELPKIDFRMKKGKNKHLSWYWINLPIFWIIIGLLYYLIPSFFNKYNYKSIFIFTFITLLISLYFHYKYKTWASMWCYISNIAWLLLLIYSLIINK